MLTFYKSFHQTVNYGSQRNHIVQDLSELETKISMMASTSENRFEASIQQPKTGLPIKQVLTSLISRRLQFTNSANQILSAM